MNTADDREVRARLLLAAGCTAASVAMQTGMSLGAVDRLAKTPLTAVDGPNGTGWTVPIPQRPERPQRCAYGLGCTGTPGADGMCPRHVGATALREPRPAVIKPAVGSWSGRKRRSAA